MATFTRNSDIKDALTIAVTSSDELATGSRIAAALPYHVSLAAWLQVHLPVKLQIFMPKDH